MKVVDVIHQVLEGVEEQMALERRPPLVTFFDICLTKPHQDPEIHFIATFVEPQYLPPAAGQLFIGRQVGRGSHVAHLGTKHGGWEVKPRTAPNWQKELEGL